MKVGMLIFVFKVKACNPTRDITLRLVKEQTLLDVTKESFSRRTLIEWNQMCADWVHADNVHKLKNRIYKPTSVGRVVKTLKQTIYKTN